MLTIKIHGIFIKMSIFKLGELVANLHYVFNFTGLARTTALGPLSKFGVSKSMQKYFGK